MKFNEFINVFKKKIVLIPLGTIASISTIVGVIHQLQPSDKEFENLISEYVTTNNKFNRFQVSDSLSSDSTIIRIERIQNDIELYTNSIAQISTMPIENHNLKNKITIAKQNLLIIIDSYDIVQRCMYDLLDLSLNADSLVLSDFEKYIPLDKLGESYAKGSTFYQYLSKKKMKIDGYADSNNQDMIMKTLNQIFTSDELSEFLVSNKSLYIDIHNSLNIIKRKYQQQAEFRQ